MTRHYTQGVNVPPFSAIFKALAVLLIAVCALETQIRCCH